MTGDWSERARWQKLGLLILLCISALQRAAGAEPDVVAAHEEPRHRLVFEKGEIRVLATNIPAGDMALFHHHEDPTLAIVVNGALMRNQDVGKEWTDPDPGSVPQPGAFVFMDYRANPQRHRVHNIDARSFQVIGIVNSGQGGKTSAVLPAALLEIDNPWFSGWRLKLAPLQRTTEHRHDNPVLVVQVDAGNSAVIEHGRLIAEKTVAGSWSWHSAGVPYRLQNLGKRGVELVIIEIK